MMSVKRHRKALAASLLSGALLAVVSMSVFADDNTNPFARDIKILTQWFEGEFDNEEQRWFEADRRVGMAEEDRHIRVHTIHHRLDAPEFGEHVFYVEEYRDNNPGNIFRQRLVTFSADSDSQSIEMRQGFFNEPRALAGAYRDPGKLSSISTDDVKFMRDLDASSDCTVHWQRVADQFQGAMNAGTCVFGEGDKRRFSIHNLVLSENAYWREDGSYYVSSGDHSAGNKPGQYTKMRRANVFVCEVSFRDATGVITQTEENLRLLSQGGTFEVTRTSDGKSFTALLRDKEYPFYAQRPDFIYFSFRETGEARSLVYTVHDVNSRRLGFNTQGIGAHCNRLGYEFREPVDEL